MKQPKSDKSLERFARDVLRYTGYSRNTVITVGFMKNATLRRLKESYLGEKKRFVDVLAFPEPKHFPHPETKEKVLGEVYVNEAFRKDPAELARMLIHGIVHLMGYRHETKRDTIKMERLEQRLERQIRVEKKRIRFQT